MAVNPKSELTQVLREVVRTLVSFVEYKDTFFKGHAEMVSSRCVMFARYLSMPKDFTDIIYLAGLLYDIGMVYVPVEIIHKPEKLSDQEMELVMQHPVMAEKVLNHISLFKDVLPIIRHHHENYSGTGYPDGLKGDGIPAGAMMLAIIDSYCAMISRRPHRLSLSQAEALDKLRQESGTRYDPRLLEKFIAFASPREDIPQPEKVEETKADVGIAVQDNSIPDAMREIVESFKKGRIELPAFPVVIQKIQEVIKSADSTLDDVAKYIEQDQVLTLRLLSVANSVHYAGLGKIQTVRQALSRIGIRETQDIISAIAVKSMYTTESDEIKNTMEALWTHAVATACLARALGKKLREGDPDLLFVLGLTHDVGKVLLLHALNRIILKRAESQKQNMEDVLSCIQGIHASFGGALLQRWGFAEPMVKIVAAHEKPEITPQTSRFLLILYAANILTRRMGYSLFSDLPPEFEKAVQTLGLGEAEIEEILAAAMKTMEANIVPI